MTHKALFSAMLVGLLAGACFAVQAQMTGGNADRAFAQCGTIANAASRLACYDSARNMQQSPTAPGASAQHWSEFSTQPGTAATAAPPPRAALANSSQNRAIVANVARYSISGDHKFTIVLDNGQTWKQLESDDADAQFKERGSNHVVISRGFLRSYDLKLNSMNAVFKVVRVN